MPGFFISHSLRNDKTNIAYGKALSSMSILHHVSAKWLSFIVILSFLVLSAAPALAENQSAPLPVWTKGQVWAVGGERDLSGVLGENLGDLREELSTLGNISVNNLQLTGSAGTWTVFKVAEVRSDTYLLEYSVGLRIQGQIAVNLSGDMPAAGTYLAGSMPNENRSVSANAFLEFVITSHGFVTIDKATMAIVGVVSTSVVDENLTFDASNFPNYSTSFTYRGMMVNLTYEDYAVDENLHLELSSSMDFAPALPLLQFPLSVGDNWTIDSKMTTAGTARGYFNATGLPSSLKSDMTVKNGVFNGSVKVQDLTKLGTMDLNNGTIQPVNQDIKTSMQCVGTKSVSDWAGNIVTVFDVKEKQSGAHTYYSPSTGFLATALVKPQLDMLDGVVALPANSITSALDLNTEVSVASADPSTATGEIAQIGAYQGVEPASLVSSSGTGAADQAPINFIAIAIVGLAAIIGISVLVYSNRKRKV